MSTLQSFSAEASNFLNTPLSAFLVCILRMTLSVSIFGRLHDLSSFMMSTKMASNFMILVLSSFAFLSSE